MDLQAIQSELLFRGLDGWLFYDHHHRDALAYRILGLPQDTLVSRRWFYLIPATGKPLKLVHRIESGQLESLPGSTEMYAGWQELQEKLRPLVRKKLAMQYSPDGMIPVISLADAGMVERLRRLGSEIVSSGDLVSRFDATWSAAMLASHRLAGKVVDQAIVETFRTIRRALDSDSELNEYEIQQGLVHFLEEREMVSDDPPIVAVNSHAGDPHYSPPLKGSLKVKAGDLVLLDVFAKHKAPGSVYYDVTWMGYCQKDAGDAPPLRYSKAFALAASARDAGIARVQKAVRGRQKIRGFEVDQAVRRVIRDAGQGEHFVHRTGHSIGTDVHSTGPNMDDFETHDEREILPRTCFSIEPGLYHASYGVRTEINMYVSDRDAEVTGPIQREIVRI